jgi:4-hydroxybenzoate polyprenyltransferase
LPYVKSISVSLVWAISTVILPYLDGANTIEEFNLFYLFSERVLLIFALMVPFDIRDINDDKKIGLKTIPILLGEKKSIILANISLVIYVAFAYLYYIHSGYPPYIISSLITFTLTLYIINTRSINRSIFYYEFLLDGMILVQGIITFIIYQIRA